MRRHLTAFLLAFSLVLGAKTKTLATDPQPDSFFTIDFPGATLTEAWGINPRGDIVGLYIVTDQITHGFC